LRIPKKLHAFILFSILPLIAALSVAQTANQPSTTQQLPSSPSASQSTSQTTQAQTKDAASKSGTNSSNGTSNDRLFYALPNFLTLENGQHVPPLTTGQKFKVVARGTFDPVNFVWYGLLAGISQANNSEPGYGQGAEGYAKRYGAAFGDSAIENFFVGAVYPSLLHQDPRFYQSGKGSFFRRTCYAVTRVVQTHGDNGNKQFNFSEIMGAGSAAAISTYTYHPSDDRNFSNMASVWGTQMGLDAITFEIKEFWPDVRRKLHKSKPAPPTPQPPAQ
jgi:hypothetical protein